MMTEAHDVNMSAERAKYIIAVVLYGTIGLFLRHVVGPQRALHFADVRLAQEEHTDARLADAAADREGQFVV